MMFFHDYTQIVTTVDVYSYAILNRGFNRGIAKWGFKIIKDSNQDVLFGACQFPINNLDYTESNDLFLIKCANGNLYSNCKSQTSKIKIDKNTVIHFLLNMYEGTLSISTDGNKYVFL